MAIAIVIFAIIAALHFIFESILLPMYRLELRYKLFELRDELRSLNLNNNHENAFHILDDTISAAIQRLPHFTLSLQYSAFKDYRESEELRKRIEDRQNIINKSAPEFFIIQSKLQEIIKDAFLYNMIGWSYILIPIMVLAGVLITVFQKVKVVKTKFDSFISKIVLSPEIKFDDCLRPI